MDSFTSLPSTTSSQPAYYANPAGAPSTVPTTATSQPLFDLQFAPEVSVTDNQQFHQLLQHHQAIVLQQQQQQQAMYDQRRDSTSSSSAGQSNRRIQSKAEKRAEHNAIERARREGLNTRFLQLAHLLPNLHHDTRPSKGTIIERTLEFVKDAIQKEERYRHEIKDLRHTNRQLLKQLTHLTTGQDSNSEVMDSDDQLTTKAPSPIINASPPLPSSSLFNTRGSSPSSLSSGDSSPPPPLMPSQQQEQSVTTIQHHHQHQQKPQQLHHQSSNSNMRQQVNSTIVVPQQRQRQQQRRSRTSTFNEVPRSTTVQHHSMSVQHTPSLSSFSSEVWHQPSTNPFWPQQKAPPSTHQQPPVHSFNTKHGTHPSSIPHFTNGDLFAHTTTATIASLPPADLQYSPEDVDMKPCDLSGTMVKETPSFMHHQQQHPDFFVSQHAIMPNGLHALQDPTRFAHPPANQPFH